MKSAHPLQRDEPQFKRPNKNFTSLFFYRQLSINATQWIDCVALNYLLDYKGVMQIIN